MSNAEDDLFASFEAQFEDTVPADDVDVSTLDDFSLMVRLESIDEELSALGELVAPRTQGGRDLHSLRGAVRIEQLKRERKAS